MFYTTIGGFFMALADSVPGVSGGTIAFIMGFYDKFISSLNMLIHGKADEKKSALKYLLKIGIGWAVGMVLAVSVLAGIFTTGIYQVSSLFLGFVIASVPLIIYEERQAIIGKYKNIIFLLIGAAAVVLISSLNLSSFVSDLGLSVPSVLYVVIAGMLAISAMVLPGISGSTLLMAFGLYVPIITGVQELLHLNFGSFWLILSLGVGVIIGAAVGLKGIKSVLDNHHSASVYAILGMMLGSVYAIIIGPTTLKVPQSAMSLGTFNVVLFAVGIIAVLGLTFLKVWIKNKSNISKTERTV